MPSTVTLTQGRQGKARSETALCDVLRWAAGIENPVSEAEALDISENDLLPLLSRHRLIHRFWRRLQRNRPAWCSPNLFRAAAAQAAAERAYLTRQLAALREIVNALGPTENPLITIKGFAVYAVTGDSHNIHTSSDIDILFSDAEQLLAIATRLGYTGFTHGGHDWARLTNDSVNLEIHRYYPVIRYPEAVMERLPSDLSPAYNPGIWTQTFPDGQDLVREIRYSDLLPFCQRGRTSDTQEFFVADVTMSLFIECAHLLNHLGGGPCTCFLPQVKLGPLADMLALSRHPEFDRERFGDLIREFQGQHAVAVAETLCESVLGAPLFTDLQERHSFRSGAPGGELVIVPQRCLWFGQWVAPHTLESLLLCNDASMVIESLIPQEVVASPENAPAQVYVFPPEGKPGRGLPLSRVFVRSLLDISFPFQLFFSYNAMRLIAEIVLPDAPQDGAQYAVHIQYDLRVYREMILESSGLLTQENGSSATTWADEAGRHIQTTFEWRELPRRFRESGVAYFLFTLAQRGNPLSALPYDPVQTIPLRILGNFDPSADSLMADVASVVGPRAAGA